jgi:AcrR family transcriptional regulator
VDATEERLMEAVREEVIAYGVRRATATSIAARAGVSRMTVYRRGGGVRQLVLDALTHELQALLAGLLEASAAPTARERVVAGVSQAVARASHAPLVRALRRHDPELLLPYLVDRYGRVQTAVLAWTQAALEDGLADGSVRDLDPRTAAHVLLHATQDLVISAEILAGTKDLVDLDAEVARLVDGYLAPRPARRG